MVPQQIIHMQRGDSGRRSGAVQPFAAIIEWCRRVPIRRWCLPLVQDSGGVAWQVSQLTDGQHLETEVLQSLVAALGRLRSGASGERFLTLSQLPLLASAVTALNAFKSSLWPRHASQHGQMEHSAGMGW